jgi:hypothetical protein
MAHTDTTTTSSGQTGLWKAMLIAIVIVAIGVGMVLAISFATSSRPSSAPTLSVPTYKSAPDSHGNIAAPGLSVNQGLDDVQTLRGTRILTGGSTTLSVPTSVNQYFDDVQTLRGTKILTAAPVDKTNRNEDFQSLHGGK